MRRQDQQIGLKMGRLAIDCRHFGGDLGLKRLDHPIVTLAVGHAASARLCPRHGTRFPGPQRLATAPSDQILLAWAAP